MSRSQQVSGGFNASKHGTVARWEQLCRDVLLQLARTNHAALPRMDSPASGPIFARLVNPTNTLLLTERILPSAERIKLFYGLLNSIPVFQDLFPPN